MSSSNLSDLDFRFAEPSEEYCNQLLNTLGCTSPRPMTPPTSPPVAYAESPFLPGPELDGVHVFQPLDAGAVTATLQSAAKQREQEAMEQAKEHRINRNVLKTKAERVAYVRALPTPAHRPSTTTVSLCADQGARGGAAEGAAEAEQHTRCPAPGPTRFPPAPC